MKIYTEINYEWLDNHLVEKSSESFDYEGELILCGVGGGGGGGGLSTFSGKVADTVTKATETIDDVITDPVGTTTDIIDDTITTAGNSLEPAAAGLDNVLGQTGDVLNEGITTGTEKLGTIGQPNTSQFGNLQNSSFGDLTDSIGMGMHGINDYMTQKLDEISKFMSGTDSPDEVTVDPDESAYSGTTANKKAGELAANKAKAQARSSLRINA